MLRNVGSFHNGSKILVKCYKSNFRMISLARTGKLMHKE